MTAKFSIPRSGKVYVWVVFILGLSAIVHSVTSIIAEPIGYQWLLLAALTLLSGSATVKLPSVPATISVSETFAFTSILLFGTAAGTLTVALDGLVISFWLLRKHPEPLRLLFNLSAPALSVWTAASLFYVTAGVQPLVDEATPMAGLALPLLLCTIVYFLLNSWLTAFAISFERRISPLSVWRENFVWLSLNYFGGASIASLLVVYTRHIDLTYLAIIIPLLLVMYLTFKTSMARVEDAKQHLAQMNSLYLSTIETLAMAIDAKDQVTHGHIRRVQRYASGLAQAVGMKTDDELRAIEAAALLHDMGKLAIPEHILNKPGKLTPAEFEKMKRHAAIGADILSSIEFPYPVVPIVRHHHENWDGSGYPDGISGTDIPMGARVLSVVDCFDALTSDRPYRPRLPDEEAIAILRQRSGSMYDPTVVGTFIRIHKSIAPKDRDPKLGAISAIMASEYEPPPRPTATSRPEEPDSEPTDIDHDFGTLLGQDKDPSSVGDDLAHQLRRLFPMSMCVYYAYDTERDELVARYASGNAAGSVIGRRIAIGEHLTGWVAANKTTISNSDPALDFGETLTTIEPLPRSCLSTPLLADGTLTGVLSLYSTSPDAFATDHTRLIEKVAEIVAPTLKNAFADSEQTAKTTTHSVG